MMNTKRTLDEEKVRDFVGDFNKHFEDLAKRYKKDAEKIKTLRECFWRKFPEIFRDSSENEVEMDIGEGKTRPKKPNLGLAKIRKRPLCNRMTEASDPSLTLMEKMIKLQKAISDATRRKIHYASLLGELLQNCFNESKKAYKKALEQTKIKRWWALFLRKLHKLIDQYKQLVFCSVSLHFIHYNFNVIEEICKSDPDNWK